MCLVIIGMQQHSMLKELGWLKGGMRLFLE